MRVAEMPPRGLCTRAPEVLSIAGLPLAWIENDQGVEG